MANQETCRLVTSEVASIQENVRCYKETALLLGSGKVQRQEFFLQTAYQHVREGSTAELHVGIHR